MGRIRTDPAGKVATRSAGKEGNGFAICLDCGRAEPMAQSSPGSLPKPMERHFPLLRSRSMKPTQDGLCSASNQHARIQRNVHLAQVKQTDVWEWQLPYISMSPGGVIALAAALREALSENLGVEAMEIGPKVQQSTDPAKNKSLSIFLYDRAAGGAGLVTRMFDKEMFEACLRRARELLTCKEECCCGCPACILQSDLNQHEPRIDRPKGLELATELTGRISPRQSSACTGVIN